jgi:DNA polymerase V
MDKVIGIIDLKSFYASCECAARHLDPFSTPLVCCDPYRSENSVVMSVTPYLKEKYGVPNVCRKGDLPQVKGLIFAQPRMSYYLTLSARVGSIFLDYLAREDIHVYSVDESFLNLGPYLSLYGCPAEELIKRIQDDIHDRLGLVATAGLGPNMFLAKLALDNEGKKRPPYLARWGYEDVETKLWGIKKLTDIWGISSGISSHLYRIGIRSVKELAMAPLSLLKKEFGIMGDQLHDLAWGRDKSDIERPYTPKETSLSLGQTLMRDYRKDEGRLILREMTDDLARRLRKSGALASRISLFVSYARGSAPFAKERMLPIATDDTASLYEELLSLYETGVYEIPIRGISISFGRLSRSSYEQGSLFLAPEEARKRRRLNASIDSIKDRYGLDSVLRCSALLKASTAKERHGQIGGHKR